MAQEKSDNYQLFSDRLGRLLDTSGWSVSEFCRRAGLSRQTVNEIKKKTEPITPKTWAKLLKAEQANAAEKSNNTVKPSSSTAPTSRSALPTGAPRPGAGMIHDPAQAPHGGPPDNQFAEYLGFIRGCREEAERISGGDMVKGQALFEKLLAGGLAHFSKSTKPE